MAKRVYFESVKKWLVVGGVSGGTAITALFLFLLASGSITDFSYSGDMVCAGTEKNPCYAYINFTATEDIFIYPMGHDPWGRETPFEFDPNVKSWKLQRSWGDGWRDIPLNQSCTGTWCGLSNADDDRKFSIAFREGREYQVRIVALKHDPQETIKWSAFEVIDPTWEAVTKESVFKKLIYSKADLGRGEALFLVLNPLETDVDVSSLDFQFKKVVGTEIESYEMFTNISEEYEVPVYDTREVEINCTPSNTTNETKDTKELVSLEEEKCYVNESYISGYETKTREKWVPIKSLKPGKSYVKLIGKWQPHLGEQSVDWIPEITFTSKDLGTTDSLKLVRDDWAWWNSSWTYKREINVSNEAENVSNYTVKLVFNSSNFNFSNAKANGEDIRFVNSTDDVLNHYIFNWSSSGDSWVFVTIPFLENDTTTTIDMYYNNSDASSTSNGYNTFPLFDDFEGASVNTSIWNNPYGTISINNGALELEPVGTYRSMAASVDEFDYGFRIYYSGTKNYQDYLSFGFGRPNEDASYYRPGDAYIGHFAANNNYAGGHLFMNPSYDGWSSERLLDTITSDISFATNWVDQQYVIDLDDNYVESLLNYQTDDFRSATNATYTPTESHIFLYNREGGLGGSPGSRFEYVMVTKYIGPEPTYTIGSEETDSGGTTMFQIWDGSSWVDYTSGDEDIVFRCTPTQTNCEPINQDAGSSQSIFQVCNNETSSATAIYMNINQTFSGIALKCDDDYTSADATTLSTSNQTIHGSLAVDACVNISCWADYSNPTSGGFFDINGYVVC